MIATAAEAERSGSEIQPASSQSPKDEPASSALPDSADTFPKNLRECCLELCESLNPTIQPRAGEMRDWDIEVLSSGKVSMADAKNFAAWSDSKLDNVFRHLTPEQKQLKRTEYLKEAKQRMDGPPASVGRKPKPGDGDIHIRKIPNSEYAFRLWGRGLETKRQYCLDWVHSKTGEPVNSPFGEDYELWAVPNRRTPWIPCPTSRLCSVERAFGVAQKDILPGHEKFTLLEGTACLFKRPGQMPIYFEVPVRPRPVDNSDVLVFDFSGDD
ncbi:hypothetical protein PLICRDRAFT_95561 [Plicaturopsis crispa FD-325 SS-3]|uniref:Uncharacterized protein n=1 Tax=Plicaturopsis crispa FD-325 SS-3 TaxID=944288 RepID=A0A0C9T4J7_PLICR|nr:hypothetical protein PLICRDRAFT_95561 [Plicaturopsis crispa FD-325 SS-3]